ncbi:MAG: thiol-disulfide oxidoreductase DCC family protein [Cyclobacteriaceae bacterium]|nr:thiol-disulfide oxidoreductase DCC family protein [Cyclobacteriaceae bacterium]
MGTATQVSPSEESILFFDGVCNLCNGAVQFIIKRDSHQRFKFASLQSAFGQQHLKQAGLSTTKLDTFILFQNNKLYTRSDAALEVARNLNNLWPLLYVFRIIPRFIRDFLYLTIAKNRYRLFGRTDHCMAPSPETKSRFIEV